MMFSTRKIITDMGKPETVIRELEIDKVTKMGINVYDTKVDGIPDGLIEYLLWMDGRVMIWNNPLMGWIATRCSEVGQDYNGIPNRFKPVFTSAFSDMNTPELTEDDDCVIIWDSLDYNQKRSDVLYKCRDYADTHMTIRQQVFNQKTPMMGIVANPKLKDRIKNMFVSLANNCSFLIVDKTITDEIKPLDFNAPYNVESLYQYKKSIEAEMLEQIGIDFKDAFQKKERLIVDEQEGNDEMLNYILADGLKARQIGIEKLKAKGLNGSTEIQKIVRPIDTETDLESANNGTDETV